MRAPINEPIIAISHIGGVDAKLMQMDEDIIINPVNILVSNTNIFL